MTFNSKPADVKTEVSIDVVSVQDNERVNKKRGWRCIGALIASIILGICLIITVVILSRMLITYSSDNDHNNGKARGTGSTDQESVFSFDDVFNSSFYGKSASVSWVANSNNYTYRSEGHVMNVNAATQEESILVHNSMFEEIWADRYYLTQDNSFVLFASKTEQVWRSSFTATYSIGVLTDSPRIIPFPHGSLEGERLQYARFGPSNSLAFVYGNNLYYQASPEDEPVQITTSGEADSIFNGIPDWNYEEDILASATGHYWSPEGGRICYGEFDVSDVAFIDYPIYEYSIYGKTKHIRYPKPGALEAIGEGLEAGPNSKAELFLIDTSNPSLQPERLAPPSDFEDIERYFTRVAWEDETHVHVAWTNRQQNHVIVVRYDVSAGSAEEIYEHEENNGWIEAPFVNPLFVGSDQFYLTILPKSEASGTFMHLALAPLSSAGSIIHLTEGEFVVTGIAGYDEEHNRVYYHTTNGEPTERHLFSIEVNLQTPRAQTTGVHIQNDDCLYNSASFSSKGQIYLLSCLGPDIPTYALYSTPEWTGAPVDVILEDNAEFVANLATKSLPTREYVRMDVGGGYSGYGVISYPPNPVNGETFPLFVDVYAGPGTQQVSKRFNMGGESSNWKAYLGSEHRIAIASMDGRGMSGVSEETKFMVYKKLGVVEIEDQIRGGESLRTLPLIDDTVPAGIWGSSYGGFVTSHVLAQNATFNPFRCGIAFAPVTNFMAYDTAYTERYMSLASSDDNFDGYLKTDVSTLAANFAGRKFFLAHGTADDNVHYLHSAHLNRALSTAEVPFRQMTLIDQPHGVGSHLSRHYYATLTEFLLRDCWGE